MTTKPPSLTAFPARVPGLRRLVLLSLLGLAVAVGAHAGEMVSAEHGFRMVWPDRWQRLTQGSPANVHLFLTTALQTEALTVIIVPDTPSADPFLNGKGIPQQFMPAVSGKEVLADTSARIAGEPARRLVYRQLDKGIAVMSIVVAQDRAYLLIGTFKGMKQRQAERNYDALMAGFRLEAPARPAGPPAPGTPVPAVPSPSGDFGSDF